MVEESESFELGQTTKLHVLVTGATGTQGGAVARILLDRGHGVRAVTRDPSTKAAKALADQGAEVVRADFDDPASVEAAAQGVDAAYLMGTPYEGGPEVEIRQATAAADAIRRAGVPHLVYSSVADADKDTGIPHFDSKNEIEKHVRGLGGSYGIVAPVFFMENLLLPDVLQSLAAGTFLFPLPEDRPLQMIAVENIAEVALLALERRQGLVGRRIDIAGDEVTPGQVAALLTGTLERHVTYEHAELPGGNEMAEDVKRMYEWFRDVGYDVDLDALRSKLREVRWKSFSAWAAEQDWTRHLAKVTA